MLLNIREIGRVMNFLNAAGAHRSVKHALRQTSSEDVAASAKTTSQEHGGYPGVSVGFVS